MNFNIWFYNNLQISLLTQMVYLWEKPIKPSELVESKRILKNSIHRVDDRRILHLANWIYKSNNPEVSKKFIVDNIDCKSFQPFANPWKYNEISMIFNRTKSTKLLRLSTRVSGQITLSQSTGLSASRRFNIKPDGIKFGNFKFKNTADLIDHMSNQECCICLEGITDERQTVLKCGHLFHNKCLSDNKKTSLTCPFCRTITRESFRMPKGDVGLYTLCAS